MVKGQRRFSLLSIFKSVESAELKLIVTSGRNIDNEAEEEHLWAQASTYSNHCLFASVKRMVLPPLTSGMHNLSTAVTSQMLQEPSADFALLVALFTVVGNKQA